MSKKKEQILDVALTLFATKGFEGTAMSEIASAVGNAKHLYTVTLRGVL